MSPSTPTSKDGPTPTALPATALVGWAPRRRLLRTLRWLRVPSCAAPFRKPVSTCTPLLKEVGQICKQLNEVQRESKAHKPSCDTFYKVCEKKPVAAGKSLSVSFGWAWAWVLPTPGSYGWSNAVHYKSVDFTAAVKALESQPIAAVVTKLQELGMKEEEARNQAKQQKQKEDEQRHREYQEVGANSKHRRNLNVMLKSGRTGSHVLKLHS